jgi:hypothetical protein
MSAESAGFEEFGNIDTEGPYLPYTNLHHNNEEVLKKHLKDYKISRSLKKIREHLHSGNPFEMIATDKKDEPSRMLSAMNQRESIFDAESENSSRKGSF